MFNSFPSYRQLDQMDCGPACIKIISKFYGKNYSLKYLRDKSYVTREGASLLGLSDAAESIGFRTLKVKINFEKLAQHVVLPCIVHWNQKHFVVVYKINKGYVHVSDPAIGLITYSRDEFLKSWSAASQGIMSEGIVLMLEPSPQFYKLDEENNENTNGLGILLSHLKPYKRFIIQLFLGLVVGSFIQLLIPFLTQSIVDIGINTRDISFLYLILFAQLMLFAGRAAVDLVRRWILLHLSTRINIALISDFLIKLMQLPLSFFDTKKIGDILQRIEDHSQLQKFLSISTLSVLFSFFNLIIFGLILSIYSLKILTVFSIGSFLYIIYILLFMRKRRELNYKKFNQQSQNQSNIIHLINGMQEIRLNNCDKQKRWEWEEVQAKLFRIEVQNTGLAQYQILGSFLINEFKNIIITFLAAKLVIDGQITLGMMLAVQFIIGQLNVPLNDLIEFIQEYQNAKISLERIGEVHSLENEDSQEKELKKINVFPEKRNIFLKNLSFQYEGPHSPKILNDICLMIPQGKITAIVGTSGSGKTTLLKLLLKFYPPTEGLIKIGEADLSNLNSRIWREKCGVVMQDGYIFSDTIANNISINSEYLDYNRLANAAQIANIHDFIDSLPLGYNTFIGNDGVGLSQGQKQRILIARAVYKNPEYLFFDEATSALDSKNEKKIIENLNDFFHNKTVVVIAHRLSTVKNADQIVVLENGRIKEIGNHQQLSLQKGTYFDLVKNQLELGN